MEARDFLATIPFFAEVLTGEELDALAEGARRVTFDIGAALIRERDPSDTLFVILEGSVTVSIEKSRGDQVAATLPAGELVGEMSLLTGAPRAATVTAETPVVALEIDRAAILPLFRAEPTLFTRFAAMLEKRQTELDKLYGSSFWLRFSPPRTNLASVIRSHFSGLPGGGVI